MNQPLVNVIMVGRDLWPMTKKAIEGLIFTADVPWALHFFSNGSTDETVEEFNEIAPTWNWQYFCGYKFSHRDDPISLAAAWNAAYRYMPAEWDAEFTMFANNDIVFHKAGWMSQMLERVRSGFHLVGIQEMTWYRFRFVEGSLFVARTETLERLKLSTYSVFDSQFKLSCEDVDLSERALRAGMKIGQITGLQPDYLVHIGHQTLHHVKHFESGLGEVMHESRRALCRKYGYDEKVED